MLGGFLALWHALWSVLVLLGLAQGLLDFIYKIHFLNNPFVIAGFDVRKAVVLIIVTGVIGYVVGWVCSWLWNKLHKAS